MIDDQSGREATPQPYMKRNAATGFWPVRTPQEKYGPGRKPTVAEWIAENAYRYDLTSTRSDSGEDGWVDYEVANEAGIAQMYEDMIAAGVGLTPPAREATADTPP